MSSRISKYVKWEKTIAENIQYNSQTPLECLLSLVIDDGVSTRGHRTNIFKNTLYYFGGATGMHAKYTSMTVGDYMGSNSPTSYSAPTITVPKSASTYTGWAKWSDKPVCEMPPEKFLDEDEIMILDGDAMDEIQTMPLVTPVESEQWFDIMPLEPTAWGKQTEEFGLL